MIVPGLIPPQVFLLVVQQASNKSTCSWGNKPTAGINKTLGKQNIDYNVQHEVRFHPSTTHLHTHTHTHVHILIHPHLHICTHTHTRVECGGDFSVFVSDNGIIMSCGRGDSGSLGQGDSKDCLKPKLIESLLSHDVLMVSCGQSHVVVVTSDNCVFAWGEGARGRLGTGAEDNR